MSRPDYEAMAWKTLREGIHAKADHLRTLADSIDLIAEDTPADPYTMVGRTMQAVTFGVSNLGLDGLLTSAANVLHARDFEQDDDQ
ncbi:MAG: hypothetical protein L0G87_01335 [Renibacterium salmoninarum]|nr:hypothetical protein [Renibacterium salmoninarum]